MNPIPNPRDLAELRGLKYEISSKTPAGLPLKVSFNYLRDGPLSKALVKHAQARSLPPEEQAAASWYLRYQVGPKRAWLKCGEAGDLAGALEKAVYTLAQQNKTDSAGFEKYIGQVQARATATVGSLADEWKVTGYIKHNGRERANADSLTPFLGEALKFWAGVGVTSVNRPLWDTYVKQRRATVAAREAKRENKLRPIRTGNRAIDLELDALRQLGKWAHCTERINSNPFAHLPQARDPAKVVNCNSQMPASDEELHNLAAHLIGKGRPTPELVAGAQLLFQALSGLRPGEPGALRWDAKQGNLVHEPGHLHSVPREGKPQDRVSVKRLKRGISPFVKIHPALDKFIAAWRTYTLKVWPESPWWFPAPWAPQFPLCPFGDDNTPLCRITAAAVQTLKLPYRRPHAMRAFYVRCRRSADATDDQIADELGERSGAIIVRSTYGDPEGVRGDGIFDWMPAPDSKVQPAWEILCKSTAALTPFIQAKA